MSSLLFLEPEIVLPSAFDRQLAQETSRKLAAYYRTQESLLLHLSAQQDQVEETVELPASALRLLLDILAQMANGNAVQLTPIQAELATQEVAELLDVPHPYVLALVETGQLPAHDVSGEYRIPTNALLTYQRKLDVDRLQTLNELTAYDQALGLQ